jgi:hypothetical protein
MFIYRSSLGAVAKGAVRSSFGPAPRDLSGRGSEDQAGGKPPASMRPPDYSGSSSSVDGSVWIDTKSPPP